MKHVTESKIYVGGDVLRGKAEITPPRLMFPKTYADFCKEMEVTMTLKLLMRAIDFACNDVESGRFARSVFMASVPIRGVTHELERHSKVAFSQFIDPETGIPYIRIHRQKFRYHHSQWWHGNWCWNRYWFDHQTYRRLIRHLARKEWGCTHGIARWTEAYDKIADELA